MKKITIALGCLLAILAMSFPAFAVRDYYYGGNYIKAITPSDTVIAAKKDGKDMCVHTSAATYCFKFSEISVLFDRTLPHGPGLMTDNNGDYILVFKNRKQFQDYLPGMLHGKFKIPK